MRKILLSIVFGLSTIALFAQIPVSTTPQNKNVVLEEYTGLNCVYCPDGHKTAHDLQVANPNDVVIVAIHQGGFATPGSGQPDYRTSFGDALAGQYSITSYPNATVNRGASATSTRATWVTWSNTILGESAYLNVGVEAQVNYATRALTVHCQVYYTGNSTLTTNKLNIALLQNNIKGPQTGGSTYNPTMVTPDGQYMHQHMLRHFFTGQWGVTIKNTNTASGTLKVDTTFSYTVPANYNSVPVNLAELEIAAYVSEGNKTIISGSRCFVNQPVIDAGIVDATGLPILACSTTPIYPKVTLKNFVSATLTSAVINYSIDGGPVVSQNWTGSLVSGDTAIITLTNPITPSHGAHSVTFYSTLPNGIADENDYNDATKKSYNIVLNYNTAPVSEEFTSTTFPPAGWILDGSGWLRATTSSFGTGVGSAKMDFYGSLSGVTGDLYIYGLDLSSGTGHFLSFDHAYAQYSTENDRLQVQVSTNCGSTWASPFNKAGAALSTAPALGSGPFTPNASQWVSNNVDLSAYDGQANVLIRFHATSGYGNNLYVDKIMTGTGFGVNETLNNKNIQVYPNPATELVNITNAQNSTLQLYDVFGKLILSDNVANNNYTLNVAGYAAGTYILKITNSEGSISKKITVVN